jgi:hypothetical protein
MQPGSSNSSSTKTKGLLINGSFFACRWDGFRKGVSREMPLAVLTQIKPGREP